MRKRLTQCPVCEGSLTPTELTCQQCHTRLSGTFSSCRFCRLAPEYLAFVELFLRCEGNLSRVGAELNLSYPTVRNRLSAALAALELIPADQEASDALPTPPMSLPSEFQAARRREILEALAQGHLGADEAADALNALFVAPRHAPPAG